MEDYEELADSSFLAFLEKGNAQEQAIQKRYILVVPVNKSLSQITLDREFALSHLQLKGNKPNTYYTLKKQVLTVNDKVIQTIQTPAGFPDSRIQNVLSNELYYNDKFESITVQRVDNPLVGLIDMKYTKWLADQKQCPVPVQSRGQEDCIHILNTVLGNGYKVIAKLNFLSAHDLITRYIPVKGFESDFATKITHCAARAQQYTMRILIKAPTTQNSYQTMTVLPRDLLQIGSDTSFHQQMYNNNYWSQNVWGQIQLSCINLLLANMHAHIVKKITSFYQTEDAALSQLLKKWYVPAHNLKDANATAFFQFLHLRPELRHDWFTGVKPLPLLQNTLTSWTALAEIEDALSKIQQNIAAKFPEEAVTSEDTVSLLQWWFVHSGSEQMYSLNMFIQRMRPTSSNCGFDQNRLEDPINAQGFPVNPCAVTDVGRTDSLCANLELAVSLLFKDCTVTHTRRASISLNPIRTVETAPGRKLTATTYHTMNPRSINPLKGRSDPDVTSYTADANDEYAEHVDHIDPNESVASALGLPHLQLKKRPSLFNAAEYTTTTPAPPMSNFLNSLLDNNE